MTTAVRAQLPPLPPTIRTLLDDESQALKRRYPGLRATVRDCVTCHGSRTFRWYLDLSPVEYDCSCADQYVLHRWLLNAGVMLNYQRLGWDDFIDLPESVLAQITGYFAHRQAYLDAGIGLVVSGSKGNGKTLLSFLLLKQLIAEGVNCYATTFSDMIDSFAGGWHEREQSRWFDRTVRNAGVLYIDDLGRERNKGPASVGDNMLETVVRSRVANNQPTLVSTNLSRDDIAHGYGGHTMSLLSERSIFVEVTGSDRRQQIQQRALTEVEQGLTRPIVLS